MIITRKGYARAGLIGNPSDGYFGKTVAFIIKNFCAEITLSESPELEIQFAREDHTIFKSMDALVEDVKFYGYYKGIRLIKAAIKRFHDYITAHKIRIEEKNFAIAYHSDVPIMVGLAGSSAIITGTLRGLMEFYKVDIPQDILPNMILEVETHELKIPAGLQDRVVQTFGGCVYMDFEYEHMQEHGYGQYRKLDVAKLPTCYVAYREELSEGTEVFHSDIRDRFNRGDQEVVDAMHEFGALTDRFVHAMDKGDVPEMGRLLNRNFDLRASLYQISDENWEMINIARNIGASAKFSGSGGAIVGIYEGDKMFEELASEFNHAGIKIIKPEISEYDSEFM